MTLIKICGITNLGDAQACVNAGADALGFNFYPKSPRYITPEQARRIVEELPKSMLTVGVFVNEKTPTAVKAIADVANVSALQLHGDESPQYCAELTDRFVIKALRVNEGFDPRTVDEYVQSKIGAVMLDGFDSQLFGGTGRFVDSSVAKKVNERVPKLFLAGGLKAENVALAIAAVRPYAVDACSALEVAPGRKDHARVRAFVEAVRASR